MDDGDVAAPNIDGGSEEDLNNDGDENDDDTVSEIIMAFRGCQVLPCSGNEPEADDGNTDEDLYDNGGSDDDDGVSHHILPHNGDTAAAGDSGKGEDLLDSDDDGGDSCDHDGHIGQQTLSRCSAW